MNINEPRAKLENLEKSKWNFTQRRSKSEPTKAWWNAQYDACEHERRPDLSFEAKQIQSASKFHHITWRKKVLLRTKIWLINIHEKLGPEKHVRIIGKSNNPDNRRSIVQTAIFCRRSSPTGYSFSHFLCPQASKETFNKNGRHVRLGFMRATMLQRT